MKNRAKQVVKEYIVGGRVGGWHHQHPTYTSRIPMFGSDEVNETFNFIEKSSGKVQEIYKNLRIHIYVPDAVSI